MEKGRVRKGEWNQAGRILNWGSGRAGLGGGRRECQSWKMKIEIDWVCN